MMKHEKVTEIIIGCFYDVYNELGYGFNEKVYEKALLISLRGKGLNVRTQVKYSIRFKDEIIGECFPDMIVGDDEIILELKVSSEIIDPFKAQLISYMRATSIDVGLILNFGPRPEIRRFMLDENGKQVRVKPILIPPTRVTST
jgi:GxxExxY protein